MVFLFSLSACSDLYDLNERENPNEPTPDQANVNDLFNRVQLDFVDFFEQTWGTAGNITRMYAATGAYDYFTNFGPTDYNVLWRNAYSEMLQDVNAIEAIASDPDRVLDYHVGASKVLKAHVLMILVDMFGNVPLSEALDISILSPREDPGDQVYDAAIAELDAAIVLLGNADAPAPANDLIYGGDRDKWITLARTLKFRAAVTTRLVNSNAASIINQMVSEGVIDEEAEDFQFQYSSNRANPDSRHPDYINHYEAINGDYMSTYYMWLLAGEKQDSEGDPVTDPRVRFYFYRQTNDSEQFESNEYSCHFSPLPDQSARPQAYIDVDPRLPYCVIPGTGYFGRDHLNNEGIPPDGPIRTRYGLYPAGGQFDDDTFEFTEQLGTTGGLGAGIQPIMLSSFVDFLRAEAALTLGTNDDPRALLESGVRKSIDKVFSFTSLVPSTMAREIDVRGEIFTVEELFVPDQEEIDAYVDLVLANYDAADDDGKLDVLMKEYFIALWGNGIEAYNMYRRTGKPNNMAPPLETNPGGFMRSHLYPAEHVNLNSNATQKQVVTDPVFWDTNPPDLTY